MQCKSFALQCCDSHHSEHVEAGLAQQVSQVCDGGVGGDVGGESSLPLRLSQLEGTSQLVQRLAADHRPDEHAVRLQHLMDLTGRTVITVNTGFKCSHKH